MEEKIYSNNEIKIGKLSLKRTSLTDLSLLLTFVLFCIAWAYFSLIPNFSSTY